MKHRHNSVMCLKISISETWWLCKGLYTVNLRTNQILKHFKSSLFGHYIGYCSLAVCFESGMFCLVFEDVALLL